MSINNASPINRQFRFRVLYLSLKGNSFYLFIFFLMAFYCKVFCRILLCCKQQLAVAVQLPLTFAICELLCLGFYPCTTRHNSVFLNLAGAAQRDAGSAQWAGELVRAGLGRPEPRPGQSSSGQGEAERHVPLSVRLLDHPGQHTEAAVHADRGTHSAQWYQGVGVISVEVLSR